MLLTTVEAAKEIRLSGTGRFLRNRMRSERETANAARRRMDKCEVAAQAGLGMLSAALARAFLRDKRDLLILGEPSAGLAADLIVTLEDGQIIEQGDHDTLMAAGGTYAHLFPLQADGYRAAADPQTVPTNRAWEP